MQGFRFRRSATLASGVQESAGVTQKCRNDGMVGGEVLSMGLAFNIGALLIRIGF